MKRQAFTMTDLLVVIAIIGVLVMILSPALTSALSIGRRAICQNNLAKLLTVMALGNNTTQGPCYCFPDWQTWPAQAQAVTSDKVLLRCPEDAALPIEPAVMTLEQLEQQVSLRSTDSGVQVSLTKLRDTLSQAGVDRVKGKYREYLIQEAPPIITGELIVWKVNLWKPESQLAGRIRIYERTGELVIVSCTSKPSVSQLWINNKPAFGTNQSDPQSAEMTLNVGKVIELETGAPAFTSYGINTYAHQYPYSSNALVLVDYQNDGSSMAADPDDPFKVRLRMSPRHLGQVNILKADGAVQMAKPLSIDPALNYRLWKPK